MDEAPVWIAINGARRIMLTCSPSETDALAIGHLIAEGWVRNAGAVLGMRTVSGPGGAYGVEVELRPDAVEAADELRRHRLLHGCGLRHLLDCSHRDGADDDSDRGGAQDAVPQAALPDAFRALFATADAASPEGGVHAAALCDRRGLHHAAVDVARHCAVDRVIGLACLAGEHPSRYGLITTSRVSGAIAAKAVHAGVAWLASRSVATPLARELAVAAGLRLLERAARPRPSAS